MRRITLDDIPVVRPSAQRKIRHHIIGCDYLSGFCREATNSGRFRSNGIFWIYHIRTNRVRASNLEGAPVERDLYTFTDANGMKRDDVENAFSGIEAAGGHLTRRLAGGDNISHEEKWHYASFIGNMTVRTKAFQRLLIHTMQHHYGLTDVIPAYLHAHALLHMIKLSQIIYHMHWSVIRVSDEKGIISSDNPVSLSLIRDGSQFSSDCSILDENVTLSFPLAMNSCLICEWRVPPSPFVTLQSANPLIGSLNQIRIASAHENIFASEQAALPTPDETAKVRLLYPQRGALHPNDIGLYPPEKYGVAMVSDVMDELMGQLRFAGVPTKPVQR